MSFQDHMRLFSVRCGAALLMTTGVLAACAPAPENAKAPPQQPAPLPYPAQPSYSQPGYSQPGYPQPGIPMPGSQQPKPTPPMPGDDARKFKSPEEALQALDEAEEELQLSFGTKSTELAGRCVRSCKALGSMRRAVDRLCDLTDGDERCENARLRLERNKQKVNDAGCSC